MEWFYHTKGNAITAGDLQHLVAHRIPAHQHLYYIKGDDFSHDEKYLIRLARTVSAMANSGGGIIIIGIKPSQHKARNFALIQQEPDITIIKHILIANINPFPDGVKINAIEIKPDAFCLTITIPPGKEAYMFSDYRYYGFENHKANKLGADAVGALHHKTTRKHLEIYSIYNTQGVPEMKDGKFSIVRFYPKVLIRNAGDAMEKDYKMEIVMPAPLYEENSTLTSHFSHYEGKDVVFAFPGRTPVFGSEINMMLDFMFRVTPDSIHSFYKGALQLRLYCSNGVHRQSFPLCELFTYRGNTLKQADFNLSDLE